MNQHELPPNFNALTVEELQEEYCKLHDRYEELREANESDAQKIHDLKRNLDRATAAEQFLIQELEQLTATTPSAITEVELNKTQADLEELRRKLNALGNEHTVLQQDYDALFEENAALRVEVHSTKAQINDAAKAEREAPKSEQIERLIVLEEENLELLHKLEEYSEKQVQQTFSIAERERNIEILRDQVNCLEENMRSKREELEEKMQLLDCTQEQLAETNSKIAMLTAAPDNNERKGNSLFAEVDDQRQAMKQLLAAQKRSYMQMKKTFQESEHEIRRLKRENIAMHTELRACSSIFCKADKTYQDKLNERLRHLNIANEELERKVKWTEHRLSELANEKGVLWLDSMFNFCKQETADLKKQLHSVRLQKASLEQQLLNTQQDMARWRFESLKTRCLLIDRENLLSENQITFKPNTDIEYHITEQQLQAARPRIVSVSADNEASNANESLKLKIETTKQDDMHINAVNNETAIKETIINNTLESNRTESNANATDNEMEMTCATLEAVTLDDKENIAIDDDDDDAVTVINQPRHHEIIEAERIIPIDLTSSPMCQVKSLGTTTNLAATLHVKSFAHASHFSNMPLKSNNNIMMPPRRSILTKKRDLFHHEDTHKNVQFSQNAPTVHNISNDSNSDTSATDNINSSGSSTKDAIVKKEITTVKQMRTKSNVVVRRIKVSSKTVNIK